MTDENTQTPGQQSQDPGQQAPVASASPAENWKARYDGLNVKVQELVGKIKDLEGQLVGKSSEYEQLNGQLSLKEVEKTVAVSERDKQIESLVKQSQTAESELRRLRALELKMKVARDLKRPELIELAPHLPDLEDEEALKIVMQDFARFTDTAVKAREEQLLAGVTPNAGGSNATSAGPASEGEWIQFINEATLGSRERTKRMDDYGSWLQRTHERR